MYWLPTLVLIAAVSKTHAQATARSSIAPDLRECYTNGNLVNRNDLPPTSMPVLIDIIRKIENNPNINLDLRMLSTQLLHTYRQDGIEYHTPSSTASSLVLPYSPSFHSFHRHIMVLRLIPSNLQTISNTTISSPLKCALHNMLSTTVDARVRGDESRCGMLSQYRVMRTSRYARSISDDVELLDLKKLDAERNGLLQYDPESDVEYSKSARQLLGDSSCPILTGVVSNRWGAVSAGHLLAGIAAGAERQQVPLSELTRGSVLNYQNVQSVISTIYPATLGGDLAEAVLVQGTRGSTSVSVGNVGNWNSSQAHRFYMLSSRTNVEMTDPEIRGGLDGFFLGSTLTATLGTYSSLRLSQLLDMYYSPTNGVFNPALRACNRRELISQNIVTSNLINETKAFASALDTIMTLQGTLTGGLDSLVESAVTNLLTYTNSNLNDLNCDITSATRSDTRLKTDLYIALDATWPYQAVYPAISYLLESIEVSQYGSSITLLSAFDGSILINTTNSLADFHIAYTQAVHESYTVGVNLLNSYRNIRSIMRDRLNNETAVNYVGGNSKVLLFLINTGNLQNNAELLEEARLFNETVPDLKILYATATNQADNLSGLVHDIHNDVIMVSLTANGQNVETTMRPVFQWIQSVGRRIINPLCGADFLEAVSGTREVVEHIEPGYINYYRISPNYFYDNNENSRVRIARSGTAVGNLIVCHSRIISRPRQNETFASIDENAITCETLGTSGNVEITLQNACSDYYTIGTCPPLFFSVESPTTTTTLSATCTDSNRCRFPYEIAYLVQIQDLGCFSSGTTYAASVTVLLFGLIINIFKSL